MYGKRRKGSKVKKKYDKAKTPYQRVLESERIDEKIKRKLKQQYESLNPAELKKEIIKLQRYLYRVVTDNPFYKKRIENKNGEKEYAFV